MSEYRIKNVYVLVNQPKRDIAMSLLQRIAHTVLPIVIKHKFRVRQLQEFLPQHPHLLGKNENRGVIIYLRCKKYNMQKSLIISHNV